MSFAKTGISATAPPSSTANRSSVIAARKTGVRHMKPKPPKMSPSVFFAPFGGATEGSVQSRPTNMNWKIAAITYDESASPAK